MSLIRIPSATASEARIKGAHLVVVAIGLLAIFPFFPKSVSGGVTTVAVVCMICAAFLGLGSGVEDIAGTRRQITQSAALVFLVAGSLVVIRTIAGPLVAASFGVIGVLGAWWVASWDAAGPYKALVAAGLSLIGLAIVAIGAIIVSEEPVIDVIAINEAGASALANFENPYSEVRVDDTNPYAAPGSHFEGYVYPPVSLLVVSLSRWLTGDVRWAGALAMAILMGLLVISNRWRRPDVPQVVGIIAVVLVAMPALTHVLRQGWTDPIALPLLAGSAIVWTRKPALSAVLLGLALASKQYFVVLAPMLALWNDEYRVRRVAIAGGVVVATILPFAILDSGAMWRAAVAPILELEPRPDSLNVIGLGLHPPTWLSPLAASAVGILLGRRGGNGVSFIMATAATLGVAFALGSQAYVNYWFLVYYLGAIALAVVIATPGRASRAPCRHQRQLPTTEPE